MRAVMVAYTSLPRKRWLQGPIQQALSNPERLPIFGGREVRGPDNRAGCRQSIGEKMYKKKTLANRKHKRRKARLKAKMRALKSKGASK